MLFSLITVRRRLGLQVALIFIIGITGCVSYSARTYYNLDVNKPEYQTVQCKQALKAVGYQEDIRLARSAAGPVLILITGGLAFVPYAASHVALEAFDMQQAREIEEKCGGKIVSPDLKN